MGGISLPHQVIGRQNCDVLLNLVYTQCLLCNSLMSLSKFNSVNTQSDKYIKNINLAHAEDKVDVFKAGKSICQCEKPMK